MGLVRKVGVELGGKVGAEVHGRTGRGTYILRARGWSLLGEVSVTKDDYKSHCQGGDNYADVTEYGANE